MHFHNFITLLNFSVVRKAVAYGVKLLGAEMAVKKREEDERFSAKELESVKADVAKLALSEETLKRTLEARDKSKYHKSNEMKFFSLLLF